ncbi:FAD-binding domain-containing protein [Bimuria novae-zelandiae CBS 107.79]|uniref:FAD-binding domain-containing protein n=1 Tax=Bimuria novae-zelandiae CBS 107.79 TaxID=1447943 RepID=A0A6A5V3P7_9PLEO|nr:FAD-binding domain-containing protein [Bimuria novae-zelandiae CBS 107.79]
MYAAMDKGSKDIVSNRWSDVLVSTPHSVATPTSTKDIIATIEYANKHKLKIIPAGGGRGSFVPITQDVMYLDLKNFSSFELDKEKGEVRIGGGCVSGPMLKGLAEQGFYTAMPNSNGVGMTGALFGGLNHPLVGIHGMGIDMVKSFTIIPFSSSDDGPLRPITVSNASTGEERKLFDVLRGAGHGFGVIISTILEAHPIASLSLNNGDKVWQRTLVFPPPSLQTAVDTYLSLQSQVPPEMNFFLGFMRSPPTAPRPGVPIILLSTSFFGPSSAAEAATALTFSPAVLASTVTATTVMTPFGDINNALDPANAPGGFKQLHGAMLHTVSASSLTRAFEAYISLTGTHPSLSAPACSILFPTCNTTVSSTPSTSSIPRSNFYNPRDRGVYAQIKTAFHSTEGKREADAFAKEVFDIVREEDRSARRRDWAFANNLVGGMEVGDVYTEEQIEDVERVASVWDERGVGWRPAQQGWSSVGD